MACWQPNHYLNRCWTFCKCAKKAFWMRINIFQFKKLPVNMSTEQASLCKPIKWTMNLFCPSDVICQHRNGPALGRVIVSCLSPPSRYLNQCWLLFVKFRCISREMSKLVAKLLFCIMSFKFQFVKLLIYLRGHWVNWDIGVCVPSISKLGHVHNWVPGMTQVKPN